MLKTARVLVSSAAILSILSGCGSAPAPKAESAQASREKSEDEKAKAAAAAEKARMDKIAAAEASGPDPRGGDGLRKASRPPAELITGPNLVYVFNFKESPVGIAAKEKCEEQAGDDRAAFGACLEKARSKVPVELVRFIKEPDGDHWYVTYNRYKGNLLKWHRVQFQPGKESDDRLTINLIGKDMGIAPMAKVPSHIDIELPNDYSIVVNDPDIGPMMYDAKVGTMETD
ncbi:MAG TPA: hypothetical protein VFZ53_30025 [Polyangiaceae bacterium]